MSCEHWIGCHGIAFVMNDVEYRKFCERYAKESFTDKEYIKSLIREAVENKNCYSPFTDWVEQETEAEERGDKNAFSESSFADFLTEPEDVDIREFSFRYSADKCKTFQILPIFSDECQGMDFHPFFGIDEKKNFGMIRTDLDDADCYVIFAEHSRDNIRGLSHDPYPNGYTDIVVEFKEKLGGYFPEDFAWGKHIGNFSYATYC